MVELWIAGARLQLGFAVSDRISLDNTTHSISYGTGYRKKSYKLVRFHGDPALRTHKE